jgi:hypothetical protein
MHDCRALLVAGAAAAEGRRQIIRHDHVDPATSARKGQSSFPVLSSAPKPGNMSRPC